MALDEKTKDSIKNAVMPLIASAGTAALVAAAGQIFQMLTVTNIKESDLTGDKGMHPSTDDAAIGKVEASANDTNGSLNKDELTGADGDLSLERTEGVGLDGEATALESGASAARTKAGAADVETKLLKMT